MRELSVPCGIPGNGGFERPGVTKRLIWVNPRGHHCDRGQNRLRGSGAGR